VTPVLAGAETRALGTTVRVVVDGADPAHALDIVVAYLERFDRACSRFRDDSDLSRVNAAAGREVSVSPLLVEAVEVARRAARLTDGRVDPTVGNAMRALGYDSDFAAIAPGTPARGLNPRPVPGWRGIAVDPIASTVRVPVGAALDLGATAKAFAADTAARLVHETLRMGVLVSLGGDIAVAGPAPRGGWPVRVGENHAMADAGPDDQTVAIAAGGLATSSTTVRRWSQGHIQRHHVLDPRSGLPVTGPFRTASVAAGSCVDANTASTAALVLGARAPIWLAERRLPSRLVRDDGRVLLVRGWPARSSVPA
jgi:FAD:protein FMN transferase